MRTKQNTIYIYIYIIIVLCILRGPHSPKLSKIMTITDKSVSRKKKCINNVSFQMCQEASLNHFGQGKTPKRPTNQGFLRDPGNNPKIQKKNTYGG